MIELFDMGGGCKNLNCLTWVQSIELFDMGAMIELFDMGAIIELFS